MIDVHPNSVSKNEKSSYSFVVSEIVSVGLKLINFPKLQTFFFSFPMNGRCGGSVVSASDLGPEGRDFEPWSMHTCCVLKQNT